MHDPVPARQLDQSVAAVPEVLEMTVVGTTGSQPQRVFYDVEGSAKVTILAIGIKKGNRLYIEGREIEL